MAAVSAGARPMPLVGRERERDVVATALDAAARGFGGLVAISGESGIGKTRLADEAVALATDRGFVALWGAGWPDGGAPPLWPWQEILGRLDATEAVRLLDTSAAADVADPERFTRFRAVAAAIAAEAAVGPVLIVLDDAHAVDAGALLLARFAVRTLRTAPVVLVVTYQEHAAASEDVTDALSDLVGEGVRLDLDCLGADAVAEIARLTGGAAAADVDVDALLDLTGGNPLLVHEALAADLGPSMALQGRIRRLVLARLAGFDEADREVLNAAAVLGPAASDTLLAAVARTSSESVRAVLQRARDRGIVRRQPMAGAVFANGLLRDALLDDMPPAAEALLHDRAARALAGAPAPHSAERLSRIARHRVAAAVDLDPTAVASAVESCRAAARADVDRYAYESGVQLLRLACNLLETAGDAVAARLLLELANAELAGGRLHESRDACSSAIEAATREGDDELLAEAVLGLGGIWVFEHRTSDDVSRFHRLLASAMSGLGERRPDLRARLRARLAAERVYAMKGAPDEVRAAVDDVRAVGSDRDLAEALSLLHHVILGPADAAERLRIADEVVRTASSAGDAVLTLMGLLWRTVDLFLAGDRMAERSLLELGHRADALRVHALLYVVSVVDVMLLVRGGRLAEAEEAAERCFERGTKVGDADALAYYGAHLLAIRWYQGRTDEMLPLARDVASSPTLVAQDIGYRAALAAVAADVGGSALEEARRELDRILAFGLDSLPQSSTWLVTLFCIVEAAAGLGDGRAAQVAYDLLLPYAARPTMASLAVMCFGPTERTLGIAARTAGRVDDAVGHLERAVDAGMLLGNRPMLAVTRADLGLTLLARGRAEDVGRATSLVNEAIAAFEAMGLDRRAERVRDALAKGVGVVDVDAGVSLSTHGTLSFAGGRWDVRAGGAHVVVADSLGMRYLAKLVASAGVDIAADELAGSSAEQSRQAVLDGQALTDYRRRIADLRSDLDEAEANADLGRAERLRIELDQLLEHVQQQVGLRGRRRSFSDSRERARTAVQKALRRAIDRIAAEHPALGEQLATSVRTGVSCRFDPSDGLPVDWVVTAP